MSGDTPDADRARLDRIADRAGLAAALTQLRVSAGMSVRELAHAIGEPPGTIGGYLTGRHLPGASHTSPFIAMLRACGVPAGDESAWLDVVGRIRQTPGPRAAGQRSPYPGAAPFTADDAQVFFGRGRAVSEVGRLIRASRDPDTSPFVIVSGASGSGKTSLVVAGVLPRLTAADDTVVAVVPLPGAPEAPLEHIRSAVDQLAERDAHRILVIDRGERLFAEATDAPIRDDILRELQRLASGSGRGGAATCVLVLRSSALEVAAECEPLREAVASAHYRLPSADEAELTEMITGPASVAGIHVEDELIHTLVADISPADLPDRTIDDGAVGWLESALHDTWDISRRGRMHTGDYYAAGTVAQRIAKAAEETWSGLDPENRLLAERLFLRMIFVDDEGAVSRQRVAHPEYRDIGPSPAAVAGTVSRFVDARVLTERRGSLEIAHPVLLRSWPRLAGWVDADRAGVRHHRRLAESARAWQEHAMEASYLLRGTRLAAMQEWIAENDPLLNLLERRFVDASVGARADRQRADRRHRRQLQFSLVLVAVLAVVAGALAIFGLHSSAVARAQASAATTARDEAQSRELAISAARLRSTDPALAVQLSLEADRIADTVDARSALLDSTAIPTATRIPAQQGPTSVALDRERGVLAISDAADGGATLWSVDNPQQPRILATLVSSEPGSVPFSVAISPDGRRMAVGNADGLIERWDITDPVHPVELDGPGAVFPSGVLTLAYSPDGNALAAGGAGGAVQRWDVSEHTSVTALSEIPASDIVGAVAYSPSGSALWVGGDDGSLTRWALGIGSGAGVDGVASQRFHVGDGAIDAIAISPEADLVVTGDKDGQVSVWRGSGKDWTRVEDAVDPLKGWVSTVAFSRDGSMISLGTTHDVLEVVSVKDFSVVDRWQHPGPVTSALFDGAGTVFGAATDGYVRGWPVPGPAAGPVGSSIFNLDMTSPSSLLVSAGSAVDALLAFDTSDRMRPVLADAASPPDEDVVLDGSLAVSSEGRMAALGTGDGRVQLWDVSRENRPRAVGAVIPAITDVVQALELTADGGLLAVGGNDQRLALWDVSDPAASRKLATIDDVGGQIYTLAFQPGGSLLAAGTTAGTVLVWDVAEPGTPRLVTTLRERGGYIFGVTFSPDGSLLAAAGADREVYLWDITNPASPVQVTDPLTGATNQINGIAFSDDGDLLAAATSDGLVRVWDVSERSSPVVWARLRAGSGVLYAVAFSPTGDRLVAAGAEQRVWSWVIRPDDASRDLCAAAGASITEDEWAQYVADREYRPPCDQ